MGAGPKVYVIPDNHLGQFKNDYNEMNLKELANKYRMPIGAMAKNIEALRKKGYLSMKTESREVPVIILADAVYHHIKKTGTWGYEIPKTYTKEDVEHTIKSRGINKTFNRDIFANLDDNELKVFSQITVLNPHDLDEYFAWAEQNSQYVPEYSSGKYMDIVYDLVYIHNMWAKLPTGTRLKKKLALYLRDNGYEHEFVEAIADKSFTLADVGELYGYTAKQVESYIKSSAFRVLDIELKAFHDTPKVKSTPKPEVNTSASLIPFTDMGSILMEKVLYGRSVEKSCKELGYTIGDYNYTVAERGLAKYRINALDKKFLVDYPAAAQVLFDYVAMNASSNREFYAAVRVERKVLDPRPLYHEMELLRKHGILPRTVYQVPKKRKVTENQPKESKLEKLLRMKAEVTELEKELEAERLKKVSEYENQIAELQKKLDQLKNI